MTQTPSTTTATPAPCAPCGQPPVGPTSSTNGSPSGPASKPTPPSLAAILSEAISGTDFLEAPLTTWEPPANEQNLTTSLPKVLDAPTEDELALAVAGRRSFSANTPGLQLVWDATSISAFLACPTRYYFSIILGLTPLAKSVHLTFGGAYQKALETYDRERLRGASHRDAMITAVHVGYREGAALPLEKRPDNLPVTEPTPAPEVKRRDQLVRAIVDHCEQFADDPLRTVVLTDGKPAVELSFRFEAGILVAGEDVELAGHLDRVVEPWAVLDHKTSKNAVDDKYRMKMELSTQMTHYGFSSHVIRPEDAPTSSIIIDVVQMLADNVRTTRFPIRYTKAQLAEYHADLVQQLPAAGAYAVQRRWPRNRESCLLCDFKRLCRVDPSIRLHIASTEFTRRLWDPAEPRTEEARP
jgi:hypothetical protein